LFIQEREVRAMKSERERMARKDNKGRFLKKGEGQDKNGRYYYVYPDKSGKRHRIYNTDLTELRRQEKEILRDMTEGIDTWAAKRTLNEQFEKYIETRDLKPYTKSRYRLFWKKRVKDGIGRMKLCDIKKSDILLLYKSMKDEGLADGTIRIYNNDLLSPTFTMAVDDDVIRKNPCKGCTKEYNGKYKEKEILTQEQQAAFLDFVRNDETYDVYYPMFQVMFSSAMRFSEVAGLTWGDVDFSKRTISVNHQVYYTDYGDGNKFHCETPKTAAGRRTIPMTEKCYRALKLQREWQFALGLDRGMETAGLYNYVFTTLTGTPWTIQNVWGLLQRVRRKYNASEEEKAAKEKRTPDTIPEISSHTFRHTGCTRLAETKMDIKSLQEFMGHSDIGVTMNIYNHVTRDRLKGDIEEAERKSVVI
jgi:integrase